jgi:hypothetical protein
MVDGAALGRTPSGCRVEILERLAFARRLESSSHALAGRKQSLQQPFGNPAVLWTLEDP